MQINIIFYKECIVVMVLIEMLFYTNTRYKDILTV